LVTFSVGASMTICFGTFIAAAKCIKAVSTLKNALQRFIDAAVCR